MQVPMFWDVVYLEKIIVRVRVRDSVGVQVLQHWGVEIGLW